MHRSSSADIQQVWADSSTKHIAADKIIIKNNLSIKDSNKNIELN